MSSLLAALKSIPIFFMPFLGATLPQPKGPLPVGTQEFVIETCLVEQNGDETCPEKRVLIQAWYPTTDAATKGEKARYIRYKDDLPKLAARLNAPAFLFTGGDKVIANAFWNAPVRDEDSQLPTLVFSHGFQGFRYQNTGLFEDLASHGYAVVSINHSYDSPNTIYPDGSRDEPLDLPIEADDIREDDAIKARWNDLRIAEILGVLKQIESRADAPFFQSIDKERLAILGHSMGGSAIAGVCREARSLKACINLDGAIRGTRQVGDLKFPLLFLQGEVAQFETDDQEELYNDRIDELTLDSTHGFEHVLIEDTGHLDFIDLTMLSRINLAPLSPHLGGIKGERLRDISSLLIRKFLTRVFEGEAQFLYAYDMELFPEARLICSRKASGDYSSSCQRERSRLIRKTVESSAP